MTHVESTPNYDGLDHLIDQALLDARLPLTERQQEELMDTLGSSVRALRGAKDLLDAADVWIATLQTQEKHWMKVASRTMLLLCVVVLIDAAVVASRYLGLIP